MLCLVHFMFTEFVHCHHVLRAAVSALSLSVLLNFVAFILLLSTVHLLFWKINDWNDWPVWYVLQHAVVSCVLLVLNVFCINANRCQSCSKCHQVLQHQTQNWWKSISFLGRTCYQTFVSHCLKLNTLLIFWNITTTEFVISDCRLSCWREISFCLQYLHTVGCAMKDWKMKRKNCFMNCSVCEGK